MAWYWQMQNFILIFIMDITMSPYTLTIPYLYTVDVVWDNSENSFSTDLSTEHVLPRSASLAKDRPKTNKERFQVAANCACTCAGDVYEYTVTIIETIINCTRLYLCFTKAPGFGLRPSRHFGRRRGPQRGRGPHMKNPGVMVRSQWNTVTLQQHWNEKRKSRSFLNPQ